MARCSTYCPGCPTKNSIPVIRLAPKPSMRPRQQPVHVGKRHLPHHAEDPQVHRQQHTERQRHTEEVHRLGGRPGPRAVHHDVEILAATNCVVRPCRRTAAGARARGPLGSRDDESRLRAFAARPMIASATIDSSVAAATSPRPARPLRLDCHSAIHATNPANSVTANPASAASWCVLACCRRTPARSASSDRPPRRSHKRAPSRAQSRTALRVPTWSRTS